jgi:formylglycine-generating enzyme required for sulfatase activity
MDRHAVTNAQFRRFVDLTGYVTRAERTSSAGDRPGCDPDQLPPSSAVFKQAARPVSLRDPPDWWAYVPGTNWLHPEGPHTSLQGRWKYPVVQVAYEDAEAYASWAGKSLPTEAEWEFAARGGIDGAEYAWGDEFSPNGEIMANTWQGEFPWQNLLTDGFAGTAPVMSFRPNGYGLYDMVGNVWELTANWYVGHAQLEHPCCALRNPRVAERDRSADPLTSEVHALGKVMKGGSHLCAPNCCRHYRPAARMAQPVDTTSCHVGFRCIVRAPGEDH